LKPESGKAASETEPSTLLASSSPPPSGDDEVPEHAAKERRDAKNIRMLLFPNNLCLPCVITMIPSFMSIPLTPHKVHGILGTNVTGAGKKAPSHSELYSWEQKPSD
jgi:hypothetical protein